MSKWKQLWIAVLVALIVTYILSIQPAQAEIKNGYSKDFFYTQKALEGLYDFLLDEDLTKTQRKTIKGTIKFLENEIAYYTLTEILIGQFEQIAPELYYQINNITDSQGRPVDVYIKFVPWNGTDVKAMGTTYICQSEDDEDVYVSEYGDRTVSVKVWAVSHAFFVLAHELGHVKYQVPNLASYVAYYNENYNEAYRKTSNLIGHKSGDPSGISASDYESEFRRLYSSYFKITKQKIINPRTLLARIKQDLKA